MGKTGKMEQTYRRLCRKGYCSVCHPEYPGSSAERNGRDTGPALTEEDVGKIRIQPGAFRRKVQQTSRKMQYTLKANACGREWAEANREAIRHRQIPEILAEKMGMKVKTAKKSR